MMTKFKYLLFLSGFLLILFSCRQETPDSAKMLSADSLTVQYASGFSAFRENGAWHLTIHSPFPGARRDFSYLLIPDDQPVPDHPATTQVIRTPVSRLIATSTTHIPILDYLDKTNSLVGFPNPDYISSPAMRKRIDEGAVTNIGIDQAPDPETVISLQPDLIMAYSMTSDLGELERLRRAGIPYLLNADYLEGHPLGRAEWIKVAGLLFNSEETADSVFNSIESAYLEIASAAAGVPEKPSALSGVVYGDTWFMPGGRNYGATLMKDAGINYLWSENESSGFLELSFEAVLEKAREADLWIGAASFKTLDEMAAAESRYQSFKAFREGQVFNYNKRIGATGGNEYLELGYLRPDLILGDLIEMAHPGLIPEQPMYFYQRLE